MVSLIELLTPNNISSEKNKFFESGTYDPIFEYNWENEIIQKYISKHKSKSLLVKAIIKQSHKEISQLASQVFETQFDDENLKKANTIMNNIPTKTFRASAIEAKRAFTKVFNLIEVDYEAEVVNRSGFNIRPNHIPRKMLISKDFHIKFASLDGIVKHEMVHVIRAVNHKKDGETKRLPSFLPTEEGLATYMQDFHSKDGNASLYQHAAEYLASEVGMNGSLRDIFNFFLNHAFDEELAWQRAVRHKFGFIDTGKPGDIMKPGMYFYNEQKIKKLSLNEILRLFSAKIPLKKLSDHPQYSGIIPEEKIRMLYGLD